MRIAVLKISMFFKLYKPRNIASAVIHYGATAAVVAGSFAIGQPWVIAVAAVLVGGVTTFAMKQQASYVETELAKHTMSPELASHLEQVTGDLYKRTGISPEKFPIYNFTGNAVEAKSEDEIKADRQWEEDCRVLNVDSKKFPRPKNRYIKKSEDSEAGFKKGIKKRFSELFATMGNTQNAAVVSVSKPIIMVSEPLLKLLDDEEEKAVLAHEFTHAKARHMALLTPQRFFVGIAGMTNVLTRLTAALSTGFVVVAAAVAAKYAAVLAVAFVRKKNRDIIVKQSKDQSIAELKDEKGILSRAGVVAVLANTAVYTYFSPAYLGVFAATHGLSMGAGMLSMAFSRSAEYQADRGAVVLGANPLALATALRKVTLVNKRSMEAALGKQLPEPGFLSRNWKNLNATHPTLERRVKRLCAIARKQGFSDAQIEKAAKGELHVSREHDLSSEVLRKLMGAL